MRKQSKLSLHIALKPNVRLGPGKADLLQGILETGSIAAAGRRMGMSYKRAWYLIDTLNGYFCEPVVIARKGGRTGGGADLTETGRAVLGSFRRMEVTMAQALADELAQLDQLAAPKLG
ncbi:MAG: LysR family transcriptional regulator [Nitrococcus sp.]|nr:LysR family transcriptional regulator [Nitrococcus sp.]